MGNFLTFLIEYKFVLAFYIGVILLLYLNRKKFEFQAKVIALYRTKIGLKLMKRWGEKYSELIKIISMIGIGVGFIGMFAIAIFTLVSFVNLFLIPSAPASFSPVLPGVKIPGSPIQIPLIQGLLALFIVIVIHEFGHGLVSKAYKIPVLSSGLVFFGPLAGAFVEPDEKKVEKESDVVKYSIFAAGPFANALTALVAIVILLFIFFPITNSMVVSTGITFTALAPDMPAASSGLQTNVVYNKINNQTVTNIDDFKNALKDVEINETISISNSTHTYTLTTTENPMINGSAYLGVDLTTNNEVKNLKLNWLYVILKWIQELIMWIFLFSFGLGAANLLPLGPVDGGRMIQLALTRIFGEKKGTIIWAKIGYIFLFLLILLIFIPIIRAVI